MSDYEKDKNNRLLQLALKKLNLRFPVAEISRRTGSSKGNVSNYIKNKKPVSDNFISTFLDEFKIPIDELKLSIKTNKTEESKESFDEMYLISGIEEKFKNISDNDFALYFNYNIDRLMKNNLIKSKIRKEAWLIVNEELTQETLKNKNKE